MAGEEVLFRGYLFRHVRQGRTFLEAVVVASGPFVLVRSWCSCIGETGALAMDNRSLSAETDIGSLIA